MYSTKNGDNAKDRRNSPPFSLSKKISKSVKFDVLKKCLLCYKICQIISLLNNNFVK